MVVKVLCDNCGVELAEFWKYPELKWAAKNIDTCFCSIKCLKEWIRKEKETLKAPVGEQPRLTKDEKGRVLELLKKNPNLTVPEVILKLGLNPVKYLHVAGVRGVAARMRQVGKGRHV